MKQSLKILHTAAQKRDLGDVGGALAIMSPLRQRWPEDTEVLRYLSGELRRCGALTEAVSVIEYALNITTYDDSRLWNCAGVNYLKTGHIKKAELAFRAALSLSPDDLSIQKNLGVLLIDQDLIDQATPLLYSACLTGKIDVTEVLEISSLFMQKGLPFHSLEITQIALEQNPQEAALWYRLGFCLSHLGAHIEAEQALMKAKALGAEVKREKLASAHLNLGVILKNQGKLDGALTATLKAIELRPHFAGAYMNLGDILKKRDKFDDAITASLKAIELQPDLAGAHMSLGYILKDCEYSKLHPKLITRSIEALLKRDDIAHKHLSKAFTYMIPKDIFSDLLQHNEQLLSSKAFADLANNQVLLKGLTLLIFTKLEWEQVFKKIRREICLQSVSPNASFTESIKRFTTALAAQCFLNEYIYSNSEEEIKTIEALESLCMKMEIIDEHLLSVIACYKPLYRLRGDLQTLLSYESVNPSFTELMQIQLYEPLTEDKLKTSMKRVGSIRDDISMKVKEQYEENPYPRWRFTDHTRNYKQTITDVINSEINPNEVDSMKSYDKLRVLIAGCGTGQQVINAQRYDHAEITAIDLSSSSIAYALRKVNEAGINNVEFIQMDILDLRLLNRRFDVIECGGVLHHMESPSAGLNALMSTLVEGGYLKLALYSDLARQAIVQVRELIRSTHLQSTPDDIRRLRDGVFSGEFQDLEMLMKWRDFFSMSACRDLCFHVLEHRFTIKQLKTMLGTYELRFLGFLLPDPIKSLYSDHFNNDPTLTNLDHWTQFEEIYPNTFEGMYQFWVTRGS